MPTRRFAAQETTTYRDLQNTMKRLGATSLRVSPRDLLNAKDNACEIVFDRAGRRYVVRCRKWTDWLDNLRAAERTIFYLYRAIDEYGVTTNESKLGEVFAQFFTAFEATPDDTVLALGSGAENWWEVLAVKQDASKAEVINAYRALAKIHHPDAGGQPEMFERLRRAYEQGVNGRG
jgi:DnaJ-domain-containing protein 1